MSVVIFRGTTDECLQRYGASLPRGGKKAVLARSAMVNFMGVSDASVYRWLSKYSRQKPIGFNLIKVRFWLEKQGYFCQELETLDEVVYRLGKALAFAYLHDIDQIAHGVLGYLNIDSLYAVLRGDNAMPAKKKRDAQELLKRLGFWEKSSRPLVNEDKHKGILSGNDLAQPTTLAEHQNVIKISRAHIEALLPLVSLMVSNEFSDEERRHLRLSVSNDGIFRLSALLSALCSRKSLEIFLQQGGVSHGR